MVHEAHMDRIRTTFSSCFFFFFSSAYCLSVQLLFALSSYAGFLAKVPMVEVESREICGD